MLCTPLLDRWTFTPSGWSCGSSGSGDARSRTSAIDSTSPTQWRQGDGRLSGEVAPLRMRTLSGGAGTRWVWCAPRKQSQRPCAAVSPSRYSRRSFYLRIAAESVGKTEEQGTNDHGCCCCTVVTSDIDHASERAGTCITRSSPSILRLAAQPPSFRLSRCFPHVYLSGSLRCLWSICWSAYPIRIHRSDRASKMSSMTWRQRWRPLNPSPSCS